MGRGGGCRGGVAEASVEEVEVGGSEERRVARSVLRAAHGVACCCCCLQARRRSRTWSAMP
eukprot:6710383-Pyramimonas_sp.AAC.1